MPGEQAVIDWRGACSTGQRLELTRSDLGALQKKVTEMDVLLGHSVQHVGLVRYNPFQETGGDQSFALPCSTSRATALL